MPTVSQVYLQYLASWMFFWLNGHKFLQTHSYDKPTSKNGDCYGQKGGQIHINGHGFRIGCPIAPIGVMVRFPQIFGHTVYIWNMHKASKCMWKNVQWIALWAAPPVRWMRGTQVLFASLHALVNHPNVRSYTFSLHFRWGMAAFPTPRWLAPFVGIVFLIQYFLKIMSCTSCLNQTL